MFLSERIKALAPQSATYFRMVAHLHDDRTRVYPADPSSYFTVGESPYGVPSGYYTVCFFTEQHRPMSHHNQVIQVDLQSEVHRMGQSQLSLHLSGARTTERSPSGVNPAPRPALNPSPAVDPARTLVEKASSSLDSDHTEPEGTVADPDLEFRKYTYAMDLEDRQQEFIKSSSYVTEVGEVFALNRIMRRELMELQRVIVLNAQQAHKEVAQVKSTVHDLLQLQRDVLANAAENLTRPPAPPPDYVGLGHSALATIREIGVALVNRSEARGPARPIQGAGSSPQLPAPGASPSADSSAPPAPAADIIDKMVSKLRATTDEEIALGMSSPARWKAMLDELMPREKEVAATPPEPPKPDDTTGP